MKKRQNRVHNPRRRYTPMRNMDAVFSGTKKILAFLSTETSVSSSDGAVVNVLTKRGIFY